MSDTLDEQIRRFLDGGPHAVVGASADRGKYGNKVLRVYQQAGRVVYPVNPRRERIEGLVCYWDLASLPAKVHGVSIITPPRVTAGIIEQAMALGIEHVWMQPGAEEAGAVARGREAGMNVIAGDACILVVLGYREKE